MQAVEIECVAVERQQRKLAGFGIELLAVAIDHDDAGPGRRVGEDAAFSEDRDRAMRLAAVVDQPPDDLALLVPAADIDRELVSDRRKSSPRTTPRKKAFADFKIKTFERTFGCGKKEGEKPNHHGKGTPRKD